MRHSRKVCLLDRLEECRGSSGRKIHLLIVKEGRDNLEVAEMYAVRHDRLLSGGEISHSESGSVELSSELASAVCRYHVWSFSSVSNEQRGDGDAARSTSLQTHP